MANFIDITSFVLERGIPNTDSQAVMEKLNGFIEKYERHLLSLTLGYNLYKLLIAEIPLVIGGRFDKLLNGTEYVDEAGYILKWDGLRSMIVDYVYYRFMASDTSSNTGKGVVIAKSESAYNLSSGSKMIEAWNSLSNHVSNLTMYLLANSVKDIYPEYNRIIANIALDYFTPINEFDL